MADFPVPVGPTNKQETSCDRKSSRKKFCLAVSAVGIIRSVACQIIIGHE